MRTTLLGLTLLLGTALSVSALDITLSEPIKKGDVWLWAMSTSDWQWHIYCFRPAVPAANAVTLYDSGPLGEYSYNEGWSFAFNRKTGDFYYNSGFDTGSHYGHVLRRIKAGETNSTVVIADMATTATCAVRGLAVADDGTVYAAQDYDTSWAHGGVIRRFLPNGAGGYQAGTDWAWSPYGRTGAAEFSLTRDNKYVIFCGGHGALPFMYVIRTSDGAVTSALSSDSSGTTSPWVPHPPTWAVLDYTHGTDANGNLRLFQLGGSISSADAGSPLTNRITELAFNPATGVITNPYVGSGNVPGNTNALCVAKRSDGNALSCGMVFDGKGNMIYTPAWSPGKALAFSQEQLNAQDPTLDYTAGTPVWNAPAQLVTAEKMAIAEQVTPIGSAVIIQ